ncbi:hypothetical protein FHP29_13615 [Nocardioides albidus]|uniref:Deoxyribonuclease NucA/NucB domain-containing protein n=1 Tax=Nocardioides albidus TaxID=1517589 RepID=A0A5C4VSJ1_9ACTN|nr:hypothetical protein [Nocardioides albidus]TNM38309.1 hypothetical protein FHP29_13615 [Nocardioides albidus]
MSPPGGGANYAVAAAGPVTITPGGSTYTTSPQPTFTASGGPELHFSLRLGAAHPFFPPGWLPEIWNAKVSTASTGGVGSVTPPAGLLEPGKQYTIIAADFIAGSVSPFGTYRSFYADLTGAVVTTSPCTAPCVPYPQAVPLLDNDYPGSSNTGRFSVAPVGNADDVGDVLLSVRITPRSADPTTGSSAGKVKLYDPRYPEVQAPILTGTFPTGTGSATTTVTMALGAQDAVGIAVRNISGSVRVEVTAIGWYPWESAEDAADELAEEEAEPTDAEIEEFEALEEEESIPSPVLTPAEEADLQATNPGLGEASPTGESCEEPTGDAYTCMGIDPTPPTSGQSGSTEPRVTERGVPITGIDCSAYAYLTWTTKRKTTCNKISGFVKEIDLKTKQVIGQIDFTVDTLILTSARSLRIEVYRTFRYVPGSAQGTMMGGQTLHGAALCSSNCTADTTTDNMRAGDLGPLHPEADMSFVRRGTVAVGAQASVLMTLAIFKPGRFGPNSLRQDVPRIRCDYKAYIGGAGCVFVDAQPTLKQFLSSPTTPDIVAHIKRAQSSLNRHWGRRTDGTALNRMYDIPAKKLNRKAAKNQCRIKGIVNSCDEYSYASTYQGCAIVTCDVAGVPRTQNSLQGTQLQKFYRANRLLDDDPFWVKVLP